MMNRHQINENIAKRRDRYMDYEHPLTPAQEREREKALAELRAYAESSDWYKGGTAKRHYDIECKKAHCTCLRPEEWPQAN